MADKRVECITKKIASYPDFPKPGIVFKDIFSVLADPPVFKDLMVIFEERIRAICPDVEIIVGLESRGFLLGTPLALALGVPFVPVRKKGKLPGELKQVSYKLEYGTDVFEAQANSVKPGQKVVIVDDLLATGGTMKAACDLVTSLGGAVAVCFVCIELVDLKGREQLTKPCDAIVKF
ncbi:adenine phosphoribosyltransferase-like [Homarus americanus]|uniref:Adenine phosphoribosyltransferase n=1 Tax=Homarus americanus TaxID=6706 RepID=A0A8J5JU44_HOMAM|nr:adenine phosphoribosyltransferase-like [Homarus americanus]XP_042230149.1 adenine phosphoribosyltransferase-like [Homarus americanus]KAG7164342.1 Adenine phosphoribosyltransferase-like [Homarus americanus]